MFKEVETRQAFPQLEAQVEQWWQERGIVKKALAHGDRARPFVFFEGPPTANGRPGVHHIEARTSKDVIIRYQRMRGHYILGARGGWDTHGLPVELEVEKKLGFKGKTDIERYGIAEFNQKCKESVWEYVQEWERQTNRVAYWVDLENPYITYTNDYIESLWWILKNFWDRDLLFRDYKVTMHCPRCGTSLSDHEVSQGFQDDVDDPSVWVRFRHRPSGHKFDELLTDAALLVWTTTPWTLPANVAIAAKPGAPYALVEYQGERLLLAQALADRVLGEENYTLLGTVQGNEMAGLRYQRLFTGVPGEGDTVDWDNTYRVIADEYVSLDDGSGLVHIAPAYGDLEIGRTHGLPTLFSVDLAGLTLPAFNELGFGGLFFKKADPVITRNLKERGLLFKGERVRHSYPFCWRCSTPLLYYAKRSWYIRTTRFREQLLSNNEAINWVPEHIKHGRFGNWLENNIDWALSRERYWGTPLPLWICDQCADIQAVGSVVELSEKAGRDLSTLDLHRPYVDEITWNCQQCGQGSMRRVPDVADCWFDSGAMPVAQWHYPFENKEIFEQAAQADYISEAIDQTRGWFYTLHAVSTLLFDRPAYKNVICLGHILDAKGEKMSKSRGNVVDPWVLLDNYGADATRWFMCASAPPYNSRNFSLENVAELQRQSLLTLWNTYAFFVTYANLDGWQPGKKVEQSGLQLIDRWALARLNNLVRDVTEMFERYDLYGPTREITRFIEELSNWYVRRNRRRFWKAESDQDKLAAYQTLYTCLVTVAKLLAPFTPFISETIYQNLVTREDSSAPESVHIADWPHVDETLIDPQLITDMALLLETVSLGRSARQTAGLRVRQPLSELLVRLTRNNASAESLRRFEYELREELNIKQVRLLAVEDGLVEYYFKPNLPVLGKKHGKLIPAIRTALSALTGQAATQAAHQLEAGQAIEVLVNGEALRLEPNDVLISATSPAGYQVADSDGLVVALNTTLTPELVQEGLARDLVRLVQDARKSAGFAISDRIKILLEAQELDLTPVLASYGDYIRAETLANSLEVGNAQNGFHRSQVELEGGSAVIALQRA
jgi:isoleucyl-tRNA synthetase